MSNVTNRLIYSLYFTVQLFSKKNKNNNNYIILYYYIQIVMTVAN